MTENEFKSLTKSFAVQVIALTSELKGSRELDIICRQLIRSATSVGANYRAACRGRSEAEMVAKLGIVVEEADESLYWLELLVEIKAVSVSSIQTVSEIGESILRMTVSSIKTMRLNMAGNKAIVKESLAVYESDERSSTLLEVGIPIQLQK